jgi:two-component system OmpR family response regulator
MTGLKLMYVDDEPDIREIASFALELDPAIELRAHASGAEALDALAVDAWRPEVILLDVMMPDMDGPTTLDRIRDVAGMEATPAIFITARASPQERAAFLARGAVGVITKPFDPMTLAGDVRSILAGA